MKRNTARIVAKYLREAGWNEDTTLRLELAALKARIQEMGRHNATEAEHFRAICQRFECGIGGATTQAGAHAGTGYATTNELEGRWRNPVEG